MASQYDLPYTGPQVEALLAKISELESEMPSKTSDLTNDSGFITSADVPTKTSDLDNDSGFITNAPVAAEAARAQAAEALLATIASLQAEITRATGVEGTLQDLIDGIAAKIPSTATDQNQLADKAFVNSSIATATAEFRGTYNSLAELQAVSADENDYGYVRTTDAAGNTVFKRYKYASGSWVFEYDLNNSSFTASQWAAINSAITAELVEKLRALPTNAALTELLNGKQGVIADLDTIRSNAAAGGTAYQKPAGGIPKTDLANGVQTSLEKAEGALAQNDIADNLTTDDAKKILSAKQGLVLDGKISQLGQVVDKLENDAIGAGIVLENNLINEYQKAKDLGWEGGAADSVSEITEEVYGQPNIRYRFTYDNTQKVVHIKFKFRLTAPLAYVSSSTNQNIMFVGGAASYRLALRQQASLYNTDNGVLNRRQSLIVQHGTAVANTTLGDTLGAQDLVGEPAYTIRYKGEDYNTAKNYKINLSLSEVSVKDGDTILESFSVDTEELVESVIERINTNSQYLIAKPYAVSGVKFSDCLQINNLPLSFTTYARTWVVRNLIDNRWHDVEVVIDYDKMQSWTNLDGYTISSVIGTPSTNNIILGGMVSSSVGMMPIQFKDFRLSYSYDDAEVIQYPANVSGTVTRLISNDSPYLIIFEGHGMEDGVDTKGTANNMDVTTDRLRRVFEYARLKGFVPVSWQQVIDWKLNGASLPKRCYTLMFDDFRIENYMRLAYRLPFVQFGVKPGLAIITGQNGETRSRNEQVTIDGQTWTLGECFDAIIKGGWYPSSHTISHTLISSIPYTDFFDTLKSFIYSCDKLGIYDDILVYPEGSINQGQLEMMPLTGFKLGISVANDRYVCRAASSYRLIRHEIGTRKALSDVLAKIV